VLRQVTVSPSGVSLLVRAEETIVEALRRQGYRTRYKCRRGGCGVCRAILVSGEVSYPAGVCQDVVDGEPSCGLPSDVGHALRWCLPCRAVPETDVHIELGRADRVINVLGAVLLTPEGSQAAGALAHDSEGRK
jgi:ferredoxin